MSDTSDGEEKKGSSPIDGVKNLLGGMGEQLAPAIKGLGDNPLFKMAGLGALSLVGLIILIVLLFQIPWAALTAPPAASPEGSSTAQETTDEIGHWDPGTASLSKNDSVEHDHKENPADPVNRILPPDQDPFFSKPILPPEPAFLKYGELRFNRPPRSDWTLEDIRPFWPPLEEALLKELRKKNHEEFLRLMAEVEAGLSSPGPAP